MKLNRKGFTLVELVMVIAILVVIAVIALPNFTSSVDRNLSKQDRKIEKALKSSGELYLKDNMEDKMILETIGDKQYCYFSVKSLIASDYVASDDVYDYSDGCLIFNKTDNEYFVNKEFKDKVCSKKDNSIEVEQKCVSYLDSGGKISPIRLYVEVEDGTKYKKTNKATITLEDTSGHGLKNREIKIYYDWNTNYKECKDFSKSVTLTLNGDKDTIISDVVEINENYTGKGQIYVCNKDIIYNVDGNDLNIGAMDSASMYLDNEKPKINDVSSFEKEISFKLKDDDSGVVGYAVTSTNKEPTGWKDIPEDYKQGDILEYSVSEYGVYYIWAKDAVGNISEFKEWDTVKYIDKPTNALCKNLTYNGESQSLVEVVGDELYVLSGHNGTNVGPYTITATLKDKKGYRWKDKTLDSVTFQCSIGKKKLEVSKFTYKPITKVYDGTTNVSSDFSVTVTTTSGLVSGDTVGVTYKEASYDDKNVGTSRKITVSGLSLSGEDKDNYELSDFIYVKSGAEITAETVPEFSISPTSYTYDGTAKKPTVTIVDGSVKLVKDTDYTVTFKNNTNVGTATVTVEGKGNYTGIKTKSFNISYKTYIITLDKQGGTGGTSKLYGRYADGVYLDSNYTKKMTMASNFIEKPIRDGYKFQGYYTEKTGGGSLRLRYTGFIDSSFSSTLYDSDITLYVKWTGYQCDVDNKVYDNKTTATNNCKKTETSKLIPTTTYSCPAGYTCSGGKCTASSVCTKSVDVEPEVWYYCPHNGQYQKDSKCSYSSEEYAAMDLKCNATGDQVYSHSTYSCPNGETVNADGNCYLYNRTSCPSGYYYYTSYCTFRCGRSFAGSYAQCDGSSTSCDVNNYSCFANIATPGWLGSTLGGSNMCVTLTKYRTCYISATETKIYTDVKKYSLSDYDGCRAENASLVKGKNQLYNGMTCSIQSGATGKLSCSYDGYELSEEKIYNENCDNKVKAKDGKNYCSTFEYHKNNECTSNIGGGASTIYTRTCSRIGIRNYYCSSTGKYSTSSTCKGTIAEDLLSNTTYSCASGYTCSGSCISSSICSKVVNGAINEVH